METPKNKSSLQAELMRQAGQDATLAYMLEMKRPLTVETYLAMNYPDGVPPMTAELWAEIPEMLRDKEQSSDLRPETEADGERAGALRLLKARHQSQAFMAQTRAFSPSQSNTPPTMGSTSSDKTPTSK